jgi:rod shape-determining protein MreD
MDEGLVWAFVGGLLIDLRSGGPLGTTAMALIVVAFMAGRSWGQGLGSRLVELLLVALVGGLLYHLIVLFAVAAVGHTVYWTHSLLRVAIPSVLLNTFLAPFVQQPVAWLGRRLRREGLTLE